MAEALDVILRLFRGEAVTEKTEWYTMRDAHVHLLPYTYPHPEVCVASAVTPSGGRLAGKYDLGMLCVAAGEPAGFDALDTNWPIAEEIAAEHGRDHGPRRASRIVLNMHLADTREQAKENIRFGTKQFVDYFNNNHAAAARARRRRPGRLGHRAQDCGGRHARRRDRAHRAGAREAGRVRLPAHPSEQLGAWAATQRSYELYARYVMPHFSRVNANRYASYDWVTEHQRELVEKRVAAAQQMFDKHAAEQSAKASGTAIDRPEEGKEAW